MDYTDPVKASPDYEKNFIRLSRTSTALLNHALELFTDNLNLVHILLTKLETESTIEDLIQLQGSVTGSLYLLPFSSNP